MSNDLMKRNVGPLDKRKNTTRCQPCATRRIRCEGGRPCERCVRTKKPCVPQQSEQTQMKFVHVSGHVLSSSIPLPVRRHENAIYLDHFASFIQRCHFSKDFAATNADIVTVMGKNPLLLNIAIAIGALDAGRKGSIRSFGMLEAPQQIAFRACGKSIQDLYSALSTTGSVFREDVFWSTFLHGLFELLAENSGNSFANHMVFGASKMLLLLEPTSRLAVPTKSLIDAFCVLEANRAILYGNTTVLPRIWQCGLTRESWPDPMNKILILMSVSMIRFANDAYHLRLFEAIESVPLELRSLDSRLDALAQEGLNIKRRLRNCQEESDWERLPADCFAQLTSVVHCATLLYHCRNFTFYSCWMTRAVPQLNRIEVDKHVSTILKLSQSILADTDIPSVLLLFPLRMAGVHVFDNHAQERVLSILCKIRQKGFVVSDRVELDLQEFWHYEQGQLNKSLYPYPSDL
ncbi:hypothetical protein N7452_008301 [Penicillium brevicompactum]|uniref:Zn(2)-C6 fungal-type domain-containing protein n=1 Tax=Penicillium brevicompactum TaxID=5074 RepID=A0A9W9Q6A4_PENBR|nr:hypothetical protein N7452_008301 [Penicillium brevicompactum]